MRRGTHAAQLSVCDEEAMKKIRNDFKALVDLHNYELEAIANHDQTPIVHETVILNTIEQKGAKPVPILTSGAEKERNTTSLTITASNELLVPYVVFRGLKIPKNIKTSEMNTRVFNPLEPTHST